MRALIFDFDGVIVDSEPVHESTIRAACAPLGIEVQHCCTIGLADEDALELIFREAGRELTREIQAALLQEKGRLVLEAFARGEARPFPGVLELIRTAAEEMPIAVCSAAFRREIDAVLRRLEIAPAFSVVVAMDDVARAKPDPAGYRLTAERLGMDPRDCVAIEDSPRGVTAACAAGMTAVGVLHTMPREAIAHAHHVVEHISELSVDSLRDVHALHGGPGGAHQ